MAVLIMLEDTTGRIPSIGRTAGRTEQEKEAQHMDDEIRPTWRLAWGLWWRMFLVTLGIVVIVSSILLAVGVAITDLLVLLPW
jgi:hypothetical protein